MTNKTFTCKNCLAQVETPKLPSGWAISVAYSVVGEPPKEKYTEELKYVVCVDCNE